MGFLTLTRNEEESFSLEIPPQMAKQAVEAALHRLRLPLSEDAGLRLLYRETFKLLGNPADIELRLEPVGSTSTRVQIEVRRLGVDVKPTVASLLAQVRAATCDAAAPAERAARTACQLEQGRIRRADERAHLEASSGYLRMKRLQKIENHRPLSPEEQSEFQRLEDENAKLTSRIMGVSGEQAPVAAQDEGGQPRQVSDQAPPPLTGQQVSSPSPRNSQLSKKGTSKIVIFAVGLLALFVLARVIGAIGKPNDYSPPAASYEATVAPTWT
jgi:hypothetical protein